MKKLLYVGKVGNIEKGFKIYCNNTHHTAMGLYGETIDFWECDCKEIKREERSEILGNC